MDLLRFILNAEGAVEDVIFSSCGHFMLALTVIEQ